MSFFGGGKPNEVENWVCVLERSSEFEVEMAKNYLANQKIPSNILSKRDSAHGLNVGEMSLIYLYVPKGFEDKARKALAELQDKLDEDE
ncbi:MAG: DUF2007 domain-containing protein [Balneolaceae bacterium]